MNVTTGATSNEAGTTFERLTDLDKERGAIGDRYWGTQAAAAIGKSVLLVEGEDDRISVEAALDKGARPWTSTVRVIAMGGRAKVVEVLATGMLYGHAKLPQAPARVFGLVDRDVWTDQEVQDQCRKHPNLYVTEGWCLENSLLFDAQGILLPELKSIDFGAWVDGYILAWALQSTFESNRLKFGKLYGRVQPLRLDWSNAAQIESLVAPDLPTNPKKLAEALSPQSVVALGLRRRAEVGSLGLEDVILKAIHGKYFLKSNPVRTLLSKYGSDIDKIRLHFAPNLRDRPFMQALIQALGLSSP